MGTWINHKEKPFDDVRVRRAVVLALDHWGSTAGLSKVSLMHTVGGLIFPGSPLAESKEQSEQIPGFWPDINKSRAEARRLLKESGAEGLIFELVNRNVDQPYKYLGTWLIDQWSKIGLHVTQRVVPAGPWFAPLRGGDFAVSTGGVLPRHRQPRHGCASRAAALDQHAAAITDTTKNSPSTTSCCTRPIPRRSGLWHARSTRVCWRTSAFHPRILVEPARAAAILLEDWPEPLREPGSVDDLAGAAALRRVHRKGPAG